MSVVSCRYNVAEPCFNISVLSHVCCVGMYVVWVGPPLCTAVASCVQPSTPLWRPQVVQPTWAQGSHLPHSAQTRSQCPSSHLPSHTLRLLLPQNKHVASILHHTCRRTRSRCMAHMVFPKGRPRVANAAEPSMLNPI